MQKFIYLLRLRRPELLTEGADPEEEATLQRHFTWLQGLVSKGQVLLAGRTDTTDAKTFGLVLLLAETAGEARDLMQADPAVAENLMSAELFPFRPALVSHDLPNCLET